MLKRSILRTIVSLGLLLPCTTSAFAQAYLTARRIADIALFGTTSRVQPDYGPYTNNGFTAGVEYTYLIRSLVQPSIEFRVTHASGEAIAETSYNGGLKFATHIAGFRPYATALIGTGKINFIDASNGYLFDNATVYSVGGGLELPPYRNVRLRVDMLQQLWHLDPLVLTPVILGVGATYTIPASRHGVE